MKITDEKWNEIIFETQAGIARWNANALKHGKKDTFSCDVKRGVNYETLSTRHMDSMGGAKKAVARELATGELRSAKLVTKRGMAMVSVKTPDPKGWQGLADKPAVVIVKKLKLLDFVMVLSATVTSVSTTPPVAAE